MNGKMKSTLVKNLWTGLVDILFDYYASAKEGDGAVVRKLNATDLRSELNLHIEGKGCSVDEILAEAKKYLDYSVKTSHPHFSNQLSAGAHPVALVGEMASFVANTTMATYEVAPVANLLEKELVKLLGEKMGFVDHSGIMTTGGSNANLLAIHLARHKKFEQAKRFGNANQKMKIFVSEQAHYSFLKGMALTGLGTENLVAVNCDAHARMIPSHLKELVELSLKRGEIPLMVASTSGTTVFGAFDPVEEIDRVAKEYDLWHHVDAAWGGAVLFHPLYRVKMQGIQLVDSVAFDAHKLLGSGLMSSFLLTRNKDVLYKANSGGGENYLFHEHENAQYDSGSWSLQCGRKVDALKFWLLWKFFGDEGLSRLVDEQMAMAKGFAQMVKGHSRLKLIHTPEYLNVCFQVIPKDVALDINAFNLELRNKVVQSGQFLINYSSLKDGTIFFRQVFANPNTTLESQKELIDFLLR